MGTRESLFADAVRRMLKPSWYNKGGRKLTNGITWVRLGRSGYGLWWRDSRVAGPSNLDAPGFKFPFGPYRVKLLGRKSA